MIQTTQPLKIFSGSSNPNLTKEIANLLDVPLGPVNIKRFSDQEVFVEVGENVRGADVFVVQSTCQPANENIMELLVLIDALRRASANSICAVMPYYGYARQDRKTQPRTSITSKLVANLIVSSGATRVLSVDLHAGQIQGFFDIPFDHLFAMPVLLKDIMKRVNPSETVIVSPDAGGVERVRSYAKRVKCGLAIIDKRRPEANVSEVMNIIGEVGGKTAILIDDMVDTAGTLTQAADAILKRGAKNVLAYASHAVLSGPAINRIRESSLDKVILTDSIPLKENAKDCDKIEVRTIAPILSKAIKRIHCGESVSSLFV